MFEPRPSRKSVPVSAETVLSNEIKLEGRLHSSTNIRFDGEMTGDVSTDGDLAVGEHGRIKGNVTARNVVVGGSVQGNVQTTGRLEILHWAALRSLDMLASSPSKQRELAPAVADAP